MKIRRRVLTGAPLLVAGAGAALSAQPTEVEELEDLEGTVCLESRPEGADITVDGEPYEDCVVAAVRSELQIVTSAEGYQTVIQTLPVFGDLNLIIALEPIPPEPPKGFWERWRERRERRGEE